MSSLNLKTFNQLGELIVHKYERYLPTAFDESLSLLQKVNKVIEYMNQTGAIVDDVVEQWNDVVVWINGDGLNTGINDKLDSLVESGVLDTIINQNVFADINENLNENTSKLTLFDMSLSDPRQYGAVGDGVVDDSDAIQSWLNDSGKMKIFRNGVFRITKKLISSVAGRTIKTDGALILADTPNDTTVLEVTGDRTTVTIDIDGQDKASIGVSVLGGRCIVTKCVIENLKGVELNGCGIRVDTDKGSTVTYNTVRNVSATSNSLYGDSKGACRGILVTNTKPAIDMNIIQGNIIENIVGEEGDAIQTLFYDGIAYPFLDAKTIIKENIIRDCNRRAIKVQGSNTRVANNEHFNSLTGTVLTHAAFLIDVINSDDCVVTGNTIEAKGRFKGIQIVGNNGHTTKNVVARQNVIKGERDTDGVTNQNGFYLDGCENIQVDENIIYEGSTGIGVTNVKKSTINNNTFYGGILTRNAINVLATCDSLTMKGNVIVSGDRQYLIQNSAPNCVVEDNHNMSETGGCIRTFVTSKGSVYKNNSNRSTVLTINGDYTEQYLYGGRNRSNGAVGIPDIMYTTDIPSTVQPTSHHKRGEVALNTLPSVGGKVGWVCVGAGTPGTWKPFGSIDT